MQQDSTQTNRLAGESSPYLLLHKDNPVDWYPWGPEALEAARREGKPIFLSVGYSTCYWCHVMERESFSDPAIAERMNRYFINVKVDREERPDLDDIYMTATQILTGHGGWPNSVFLTPDLEPFYAGTYFPPEDRYGRPGFGSLVENLGQAWQERPEEVEQHAAEVATSMRRFLEERFDPADEPPSPALAVRSYQGLTQTFDAEWGGFGSAPKFPSPSNLFLLLELAGERPQAGPMLHTTLDAMARGGIYDQLAGGFHRYATDREWKVPHFEKMLYDNGFLLEAYAREHRRTGDPEMALVVRETAAFLAREMTSPEGALYSAIDAETDGREGAYYVWTRDELEQVLGEEDFLFLAPVFGFDGDPFFEEEEYVLHLPRRLEEVAEERHLELGELLAEIEPLREKLLAARAERERPLTDDKILTDWNGIAISGLATAGHLLGEEAMVRQAERAARFVLEELWPEAEDGAPRGPLLHTWRGGEAKLEAFLADYAFLVRGLLALHRATGEEGWLTAAAELTDEQIRRLRTPDGGFYSAEASEDLLVRTRDVLDGATPSGNGAAVLNLLALAERLQGERGERFRREAEAALTAFGGLAESYPEGVRTLALGAWRHGGGAGAAEVAGQTARAAGGAAGEALEAEARAALEASARFTGEAEGGWRPFRLDLELTEGWHVNANPSSDDFLIPTRVGSEAELRSVEYPQPEHLEAAYAEEEIAVYRRRVSISGELRVEGEEAPSLALTYQPCDDQRCLRPVTVAVAVE